VLQPTPRQTVAVPLPRLRSPLARAVVPVLGGLAVLGVLGLLLWGMAAFISRGDAESSQRLAPTTFRLGPVTNVADEIAESGPLLIPGLNTTIGERTIVVDHEGDDPTRGWVVYYAHPADREPSCAVEQERGTERFVDCDGRTIAVTELAPPSAGVRPIVEDRSTLILDLRGVTSTT
jgi:hypothetical protein